MAEPIVPVPEPTPSTAQTTAVVSVENQPPPEAPRKRRRWWILALVLLLVGILLVVAYIVAERFARDYAEQLVRDQVVQVLSLDEDTEVGVDLGEGSLIAQAIAGKINTVTVDVAELTLGEITASAVMVVTGVPLDSTKPVETMRIVATITEANVSELAGYLSSSELKTIELGNGVITVATEFNILNFFVIPVRVDLEPSVISGGISFDPKTIYLGDAEISVADLRNDPQFSAFAGDLLASRDFCVADQLPVALTLTAAKVVGSNLVLTVRGDGAALGDPALSTLGVCKEK